MQARLLRGARVSAEITERRTGGAARLAYRRQRVRLMAELMEHNNAALKTYLVALSTEP